MTGTTAFCSVHKSKVIMGLRCKLMIKNIICLSFQIRRALMKNKINQIQVFIKSKEAEVQVYMNNMLIRVDRYI